MDLDEEAKRGLVLLNTKVVERLRFERLRIYVEVIERREYVRPAAPDAGVISVPPPLAILPGVKYDFSVIATNVEMKMNFHQPTYRQQDFFGQAGYFMSRSTRNDLINFAAIVTVPLFQEQWRLLLRQPILLGDDTRVRLLKRGALSEEDWEKVRRRSGSRSGTGPPGSVTSWSAANNLFLTASELAADEWKAAYSSDEENAERAMRQFVWCLPVAPTKWEETALDAHELTCRMVDLPRGVVPRTAQHLTAGVDLGKYVAHWIVVAWSEQAAGQIVDYGRLDIASEDLGVEQAILTALREFRNLCQEGWPVGSADGDMLSPRSRFPRDRQTALCGLPGKTDYCAN